MTGHFELCREEAPDSMAELVVKHRLDADGLLMKDLVAERDFLAQRLGVPEHLLQVLSWEEGSITITYWIVRDVLPLAELALCREDALVQLSKGGVEAIYLDCHPSEHTNPVCSNRYSICCLFSLLNIQWPLLSIADGPINGENAL